MFILHRSSNIRCTPKLSVSTNRQAVWSLLIGSAVMMALSGCGQKGELYLAQPSSQTITDSTASDKLASTSHPQDAAFATIDDDDYEKRRYLEQKQVLPAVSNDPNDY